MKEGGRGGEQEDTEGDCITPPPPSPTVLHGICLLAQLRNCVPAKWSERAAAASWMQVGRLG